MSILDRYIARQYLFNIAALFVILFCMVVAIDASWNAGRYLGKAAELAADEGHEGSGVRRAAIAVLLVTDLWWPRLLQLFNYMNGLVLVGAMGFTCTQLVRHRELVAVLASGQSLVRIARPFLIVALGFLGLQALNQELVLPRIAPLLVRDHGDAGRRGLGASSIPLTPDGRGRLWYASTFDADAGTLRNVYIWERDASGVAVRRVHAPAAEWSDGGWTLADATVEARRTEGAGAEPGAPRALRIETDLDPTAMTMRRFEGFSQNLSWAQATRMLERINRLGLATEEARESAQRLERIRFGRVSIMACNLLTLAICLPFFLTRAPQNMLIPSLKAAPLAIVALVGAVLGVSTPVPGLPAAVAVFIPALVLLPVTIAMASTIKT